MVGKQVIYMGEISLLHALKMRLKSYQVVRFWVGTDVLLLHKFPPGRGKLSVILHRIKAYLLSFVVNENWVDGVLLTKELRGVNFLYSPKNCRTMLWPGKHGKYPKQTHKGINIGFYSPNDSAFARWKYGLDLIESARKSMHNDGRLKWIELDGTRDMSVIYSLLDLLVRPSRHDGMPRMILEAEENEIPVIYDETFSWTKEKFNQALLEAINKLK